MKLTILNQLPQHARWMIEQSPLDYDFTASPRVDENVSETDPEWRDLKIFGKYDFAEGGGASPWLCVRETDGAVVGLDPESENAVFLINSSLDRFIQSFKCLNDFLGAGRILPKNIGSTLRDIDPKTYFQSDWRILVERLVVAE